MKKVLVFGTFDHLHPGHRDFFRQAKALGDYLIVVVATDTNVKKVKNSDPKYPEEERVAFVKKEPLVDEVILGSEEMDYLQTIKDSGAEVIALGYDQNFSEEKLLFELKQNGLVRVKVVRLKSFQPEKYKSSLLK